MRTQVTPHRNNKLFLKFLRELEDRMRAVSEAVTYESAKFVLEEIQSKLPQSGDSGEYSRSLEVVAVGSDRRGFAIRSKGLRRKIKDLNAEKTVLYVRPKSKKILRTHPEIGVLARYSPWTLDTLPFYPPKKQATVMSRPVRKGEIDAVRRDRLADKSEWLTQLNQLGIRPDKALRVPPKAEVVPDIAFEAIRMEFGLGGTRRVPHWRPALRALANDRIQRMLSPASPISSPMTDPFSSWARPQVDVDAKISESEASKFKGFMKRLKVG